MVKAVELAKSGAYEEALRICRKIKSNNINNAVYFNVAGIVCRRLGFFDEALSNSKRAIQLDKNLVSAKMNIANIELQKGEISKAIKSLELIVREQPNYHEAKANLALAYRRVGQIDKSLGIYERLEFHEPWGLKARFNYGTTLITNKGFEQGWQYYEYRWKVSPQNQLTWPLQSKPIWKGEKGKRVVVWKEQGLGDQIIFLSLVQEVKRMCDTLSVYVDPRLQSLCKRAMPDIHFIENEETLNSEQCDYHLPIQSLGGLVRNDISDFDRTVRGYLKADPKRVEAIRKELKLDGKTAIGISWKSFKVLNILKKSVQLKDMERIFSGLDVVLVNLQYGDVEDEIREFTDATGIDVVQCASVDNREDLDGLAALIEVCDLVVSTSNATVHLAGALSKETWVLLHYVSIYYWLVERRDSIWYPSLSLYRQPTLDDWNSVYGSIRKDLEMRFQRN